MENNDIQNYDQCSKLILNDAVRGLAHLHRLGIGTYIFIMCVCLGIGTYIFIMCAQSCCKRTCTSSSFGYWYVYFYYVCMSSVIFNTRRGVLSIKMRK